MKAVLLLLSLAFAPFGAFAQTVFSDAIVTNVKVTNSASNQTGCLQFDIVGVTDALAQGTPPQRFSIPLYVVPPYPAAKYRNPDYEWNAEALLNYYRSGKPVTVITETNTRDACGAVFVTTVRDARLVE